MSVLIKDMGIPESCAECRFCVNGFTDDAPMYECACESYENVSVLVDDNGQPFDFRPDWCPLIEVPTPHGRLIDAEALIKELKECMYVANNNWEYEMVTGYSNAIESVEEACTIIEAEGSET